MNLLRNLMGKDRSDGITANDLKTIQDSINNVVTVVFSFLALAAVIVAIMLAYKFFTATDEGKRKNAKMQLIYSIIAVIVLVILSVVIPQVINSLKSAADVTAFKLVF